LEIVFHASGLFAQFAPGLIDVQVEVGIFFEIGLAAVGAIEEAVDDGRFVAEGGPERVFIFFELKRAFADIVVGGALGIIAKVGLEVFEAEELVLPELGVEFEGDDVGVFDVEVEGVAEMEDQFATDVHGPEEVGRFFESVACDLP
jgi:hypothetical protein